MIDVVTPAETAPKALRRGAVVIVALLALMGLAAVLTARDDSATARSLCKAGAGAQFAGPVRITSAGHTQDGDFLVHGVAGTRTFTCLVSREPVSDHWELASVS